MTRSLWRRLFWVAVLGGLLVVGLGLVEPRWVIAPLLGLAVARFGFATVRSFGAPASHVPQAPPQPVDLSTERTLYRCDGCGAELLLVVRGSDAPPRHCGERMSERREVARS